MVYGDLLCSALRLTQAVGLYNLTKLKYSMLLRAGRMIDWHIDNLFHIQHDLEAIRQEQDTKQEQGGLRFGPCQRGTRFAGGCGGDLIKKQDLRCTISKLDPHVTIMEPLVRFFFFFFFTNLLIAFEHVESPLLTRLPCLGRLVVF